MMNRKEFEKTLLSQECVTYWLSKSREEVFNLLGSDIANMVGFAQNNPHHCYDLFSHSLHTVKNIQNRLSVLSRENICLLVAAFFHDVGKVSTAKCKEGRLVFYGHAKESAMISRDILTAMGYENNEIEQICFYISHHDDFISYVLATEAYNKDNPYLIEITEHNVRNHIEKENDKIVDNSGWYSSDIWHLLLKLCYADAEAQVDNSYSKPTCDRYQGA